eukprot:c21687_g4_i1 orf=128-439(+)
MVTKPSSYTLEFHIAKRREREGGESLTIFVTVLMALHRFWCKFSFFGDLYIINIQPNPHLKIWLLQECLAYRLSQRSKSFWRTWGERSSSRRLYTRRERERVS